MIHYNGLKKSRKTPASDFPVKFAENLVSDAVGDFVHVPPVVRAEVEFPFRQSSGPVAQIVPLVGNDPLAPRTAVGLSDRKERTNRFGLFRGQFEERSPILRRAGEPEQRAEKIVGSAKAEGADRLAPVPGRPVEKGQMNLLKVKEAGFFGRNADPPVFPVRKTAQGTEKESAVFKNAGIGKAGRQLAERRIPNGNPGGVCFGDRALQVKIESFPSRKKGGSAAS